MVAFTLTMPGAPAGVTNTFGEGKRYVVYRSLDFHAFRQLLQRGQARRSWTHAFGDGWLARVTATEVPQAGRSDGFGGYDWMVDDIIRLGEIVPRVTR